MEIIFKQLDGSCILSMQVNHEPKRIQFTITDSIDEIETSIELTKGQLTDFIGALLHVQHTMGGRK